MIFRKALSKVTTVSTLIILSLCFSANAKKSLKKSSIKKMLTANLWAGYEAKGMEYFFDDNGPEDHQPQLAFEKDGTMSFTFEGAPVWGYGGSYIIKKKSHVDIRIKKKEMFGRKDLPKDYRKLNCKFKKRKNGSSLLLCGELKFFQSGKQ